MIINKVEHCDDLVVCIDRNVTIKKIKDEQIMDEKDYEY